MTQLFITVVPCFKKTAELETGYATLLTFVMPCQVTSSYRHSRLDIVYNRLLNRTKQMICQERLEGCMLREM